MKVPIFEKINPLLASLADFPRRLILVVFTGLWAVLTACSFSDTHKSGKTQPLRLAVGEIKEVSLRQSADSTLEMSGTSENNEIVDITPRQPAGKSTYAARSGKAAFLIKGVTPGSAKVIISRKRTSKQGPGLPLKTYQVNVVAR